MAIGVRAATLQDEPAARRVSDEAFAGTRSLYRPTPAAQTHLASIAEALQRLVAEEEGQIVGTVRFGVFEDVLRVIGLPVLPEFRRLGAARALLNELARIARQNSCRALALYTIRKTGNVEVFRRLGFRVVSEEPDSFFVGPDGEPLVEAYMERSIDDRHASSPKWTCQGL